MTRTAGGWADARRKAVINMLLHDIGQGRAAVDFWLYDDDAARLLGANAVTVEDSWPVVGGFYVVNPVSRELLGAVNVGGKRTLFDADTLAVKVGDIVRRAVTDKVLENLTDVGWLAS